MKQVEIIYKNDKPYGIRNSDGFLLFFSKINKFEHQDERYSKELAEQLNMAKYILKMLKLREE